MTFLSQIVADYPKWNTGKWLHYSNFPMLKINPDQFHQDPSGIYLFPETFQEKGAWRTSRYKFEVTLKEGVKILDLATMSPEDCLGLMEKLGYKAIDEDIEAIKTKGNHQDRMWELLVNKFMGHPAKFNKALRSAGYDAVFDDTGSIHSSEVQLLVLDPTKVRILKQTERKKSGFATMQEVIKRLTKLFESYGEVKTEKHKKKYEAWDKANVLYSYITCQNKASRATWKITASSSTSDKWGGEKGSKDKPHSVINISLSGSSKSFDYSVGYTLDIQKPDWKEMEERMKQTMDKIWESNS